MGSELMLYGHEAVEVRSSAHGWHILRPVQMLPLEMALEMGGLAEPSLKNDWFDKHDYRIALPETAHDAQAALEEMAQDDQHRPTLAEALRRSCPSFRVAQRLYLQIGGRDKLRSWEDWRALPTRDYARMIYRLARARTPPGGEEWKALYQLVCHPHSRFMSASQMEALLRGRRRVGAQASDHDQHDSLAQLWAGSDQSPQTIDLCWPDLTRRILIIPDAERWSLLEISCSGSTPDDHRRHVLTVCRPGRVRRQQQLSSRQVLEWLQEAVKERPLQAWQHEQLCHPAHLLLASCHKLGPISFARCRLSPLEDVVRRFAPSERELALARDPTLSGQQHTHDHSFDYSNLAALRERARHWQLAGRSRMEKQELRHHIAQAASHHVDRTQLALPPSLVRKVSLWPMISPEPPLEPRLDHLESLACHTSQHLFHPALGPHPSRLPLSLTTLEAYRPHNPFTD